jgi:hypothetical protein
VVANVAGETAHGEDGLDIRQGLRHFVAGARVWVLPPQWGDGGTDVLVAGTGAPGAGPGSYGRPATAPHGLPGPGRLQPCGGPRADQAPNGTQPLARPGHMGDPRGGSEGRRVVARLPARRMAGRRLVLHRLRPAAAGAGARRPITWPTRRSGP